jgi:hypothetical protein
MIDLFMDPESFEDAYNHPEVEKKIKWQHAILKKGEEMKT